MNFEQLKAQETEYVMSTYNRFQIAIERGDKSVLWDTDGKSYIDMTCGIGVCSVGHKNEKLICAINEQAQKIMHVSNLFITEPMVKTAKILVESTGMGKVFFSNSGAESNEGAIKLARKYSFDKYGSERYKIITLSNSFHGRTITTLKATGQQKFHNYFFPFTEGFEYAVANNIESIKSKIDNKTCAIMIELIQGEGGVLPLEKDFVKEVYKICEQNDLLLIIDEVQTGIGRTGSLFCFEQYDIKPDIVTMAKGLGGGVPIGAVMASRKCCDVLDTGTHATTFGGMPIVCAAANAVLEIVNNKKFLDQVRQKGEYIKKEISSIKSDKIKGIRGMGLMLGIVVNPEERAQLLNKCIENGVLVITAGEDAIRLLPPLTISYEEIDIAIDVFKKVFI